MSHKRDLLSGPRISPHCLQPGMSVSDLVRSFRGSGSFQAGRLAEAGAIYRRMIQQNAGIGLTLSGAMAPAGMGAAIATMIRKGFIDWIISTGANVFHDLHFALGLPLFQGDFHVDDVMLRQKGIDRIYDIFLEEETIIETERFVMGTIKRHTGRRPRSTAELHHLLGRALLERGTDPEVSFMAAAAEAGLPIYTSSPGDSVLGLDLACLRLKKIPVTLDPITDVIETSAIVLSLEKNGVVIVGGGSPKNFYLQTQPFLKFNCGIKKEGHDFDIQIATDPPHWGGLSGATPNEAVSWGKINPGQLEKNSVVVYADATIALPILFGYVLSEEKPRPLRRLYSRRKKLVDDLQRRFHLPIAF